MAQVTEPLAFAQLYQVPAAASWILTAEVVVGLIVKATESMFVGVVAFSVYATFVAVSAYGGVVGLAFIREFSWLQPFYASIGASYVAIGRHAQARLRTADARA